MMSVAGVILFASSPLNLNLKHNENFLFPNGFELELRSFIVQYSYHNSRSKSKNGLMVSFPILLKFLLTGHIMSHGCHKEQTIYKCSLNFFFLFNFLPL